MLTRLFSRHILVLARPLECNATIASQSCWAMARDGAEWAAKGDNVTGSGGSLQTAQRKVEALLNPRNVAIVGASDAPASWAMRAYANLRRYGFAGAIYPINPRRDRVWDMRGHGGFGDLPEPPIHVVVAIPAPLVAATLRAAAALAGARSANVMSGFRRVPGCRRQGAGRWLAAGNRRDRACGVRAELHGQHPCAGAVHDPDGRPAAPPRVRSGRHRGAVGRPGHRHRSARRRSAALPLPR